MNNQNATILGIVIAIVGLAVATVIGLSRTPTLGGVNWHRNSVFIARESGSNLIEGANVSITAVDEPGSERVSYTIAASSTIGANNALSNLAAVAVNTTLLSDADVTDDLGSASIRWRTGYFQNVLTTNLIGNTALTLQGSTISLVGATTLGSLTATGTLTVGGTSALNNGLTVNGNSTIVGSLTIAGALSGTSTLTLSGLATLHGGLLSNSTLTVVGNSTLSNVTATGTLTVNGATTLNSGLTVAGGGASIIGAVTATTSLDAGTTTIDYLAVGTNASSATSHAAIVAYQQYFSNEYTATSSINWANSNVQYILMGNGTTTFTMINPKAGARYLLILEQPASGTSGTALWPSNVYFANGATTTLTTTPGKMDLIGCAYEGTRSRYLCAGSTNY